LTRHRRRHGGGHDGVRDSRFSLPWAGHRTGRVRPLRAVPIPHLAGIGWVLIPAGDGGHMSIFGLVQDPLKGPFGVVGETGAWTQALAAVVAAAAKRADIRRAMLRNAGRAIGPAMRMARAGRYATVQESSVPPRVSVSR
jgi:hypothetical protein